MHERIKDQILSSLRTAEKIAASDEIIALINNAADAIISAIGNNGKVMIAGNGGSAADSQHIAAEFINRFYFDRDGLPAIALTTDTSVLTAIGNDYSFNRVFSRQISSFGNRGDIFMALSTSGNSVNIIEALNECRIKGITTIGFSGSTGGKMSGLCDILIKVPSDETPRIQEMHILIAHIICGIVEETIFKKPVSGK